MNDIKVNTLQSLQEITGANIMDAMRALSDAGGDYLLAEGILLYRGCAINLRGKSKIDWVMARAHEFKEKKIQKLQEIKND